MAWQPSSRRVRLRAMTTPRDPGRSLRDGSSPRRGDPDGSPPGQEGPGITDERWTPEDRYVIERQPRFERREPPEGWEPERRRRGRPVWASAALAALLGAVLVGLVVAAVVLPRLAGGPAASEAPTSAPSPSLVAASASASRSPSPSPTATPSVTPLPSVLEVRVRSGDSLNVIADRYGTDARSLAFWNRDRYPTLDPQSPDYEPDQIQVGWTLVVYPGETFPEPSGTTAPSGTTGPSGSAGASAPAPSASTAP
jgi:hypothetical protein